MKRREVRVAESFFEELDVQLGQERGPNGEPSATDFLVFNLPSVVERFATGFEGLPQVMAGSPTARMYIGTSALLREFVVHGLELEDGIVTLVGIEIDE